MSVILGIDPSLTNTGLCWGDGHNVHRAARVVTQRVKDPKAIINRVQRLKAIVSHIREHLAGEIKPDLIMIEAYSFGSRNGGEYLGELGGVLRWELYKHVADAMNVVEVAPSAVKKFATGKGTSKKEAIIGHIQKRWNVLFENSDEADAYVLYRIGLCYAGICEPENQAQREVMAKLKGK